MPVYEGINGTVSCSIPEECMNRFIPEIEARGIYSVVTSRNNGGFEKYYRRELTYKMFINRLAKAELIKERQRKYPNF
ncbi:MAG: hypothetical protein KKB25_01475 [Nanoarchaeota archaeon]|nr:hypothetical protein [Nanoarchaeota archaeon]